MVSFDSFGVKRVLEITIKIMITIKTLNPNRNRNLNPGPSTSDVYTPINPSLIQLPAFPGIRIIKCGFDLGFHFMFASHEQYRLGALL